MSLTVLRRMRKLELANKELINDNLTLTETMLFFRDMLEEEQKKK